MEATAKVMNESETQEGKGGKRNETGKNRK